MINSLHIENIAVIEKLTLDLSDGFVVLTGQTGAGKSILINSLQMILGDRLSKDAIRSGCEKAVVSASFSFLQSRNEISALCDEMGIDFDGEIIVRREATADGRSRAFVNGSPVTLAMLKNLGSLLINIHGQHDNHALMNTESHRVFLDKYAKNDAALASYAEIFSDVKKINAELNSLITDDKQKEQRAELLRFEIEEIESACLEEEEEEALLIRRKTLMNFEKIKNALDYAYENLLGDDGADNMLRRAKSSLSGISALGEDYEKLYDNAEAVYDGFSDLAHTVRDISDSLEYDEEELDNIEQRLDQISKLKRKYGYDIEAVLKYLEAAKKELDEIATTEERQNKLASALFTKKKELKSASAELTNSRKAAAKTLSEAIISDLSFLEMPRVVFSVDIQPCEPCENGADKIEFLISANVGQPPRPLSKIASGGELSRIMLSIKNVLSACDCVETLIFDEIDTGVSGSAADKIAKKMKEMSEKHQVLCVTHLPQIAAYASEHFLIDKTSDENHTYTTVTLLNEEGRINEIARIIGGENITEALKQTAKELIYNANR